MSFFLPIPYSNLCVSAWFLGPDDLDVQPLFHLISCVDPDLSQGIPVPDFVSFQYF